MLTSLQALLRLATLRWLSVFICALATLLSAASTASALEPAQTKTRVWGFDFAADNSAGLFRAASGGKHQGNRLARAEEASGSLLAARGAGVVIEEGKLGYLLGQASGRAHNVERALQNAGQLSRVGVHESAAGRALLQSHLEGIAGDASNVARAFSNQYGHFVVKESLFAGPGGFLQFESTWQVMEGGGLRLTTAIPFGG